MPFHDDNLDPKVDRATGGARKTLVATSTTSYVYPIRSLLSGIQKSSEKSGELLLFKSADPL